MTIKKGGRWPPFFIFNPCISIQSNNNTGTPDTCSFWYSGYWRSYFLFSVQLSSILHGSSLNWHYIKNCNLRQAGMPPPFPNSYPWPEFCWNGLLPVIQISFSARQIMARQNYLTGLLKETRRFPERKFIYPVQQVNEKLIVATWPGFPHLIKTSDLNRFYFNLPPSGYRIMTE